MDQVINDSAKIIATLGSLFKKEGRNNEFLVLSQGSCFIKVTGFDNWDGGTDMYGIFCKIPIELYSNIENEIQTIEQNIREKAETLFRNYPLAWIGEVVVSPELTSEIIGKAYNISNQQLLEALELQKSMMISVSTGGPSINNVNHEYKLRHQLINDGLGERNFQNPNPYKDLWDWYGKWSDRSLPTYYSRRIFISEMYDSIIEDVRNIKFESVNPVFEEPTGWIRVDRSVREIKHRLVQATNEEQFQAVGLLCRETLISLAQEVYQEDKHLTTDGVNPSKTDTKRMLEAYVAVELRGKSNEDVRRFAKSSLALANKLTHSRTADFRLAALCAEATNAVVNIIAIISGRRDKN